MRRSIPTILLCLLFSSSWLFQVTALANPPIDQLLTTANPYQTAFDPVYPPVDGPHFVSAGFHTGRVPSHAGSVVKCKPEQPSCPVMCPPPVSPMKCILPTRRCGQWEAAVQVLFARQKGTAQRGVYYGGIPTTEVDLNDDLGISAHQTFLEYSGRFQFRPNWALYYSVLPIEQEGSKILERNIYWGQWLLAAGTRVHTKWNFLYQRVGLLYQPISNCSAVLSIFAGWVYNDQRLKVQNEACGGRSGTVDRTRNMVNAGMQIEKCLSSRCNGATLSCDSRAGVTFLDNTFVLDVEGGARYSIPLGSGRWGYARGGYRYLNFREDRNDLRWDTTLEGGFAEGGIIF